jgi:hypothetical protein
MTPRDDSYERWMNEYYDRLRTRHLRPLWNSIGDEGTALGEGRGASGRMASDYGHIRRLTSNCSQSDILNALTSLNDGDLGLTGENTKFGIRSVS